MTLLQFEGQDVVARAFAGQEISRISFDFGLTLLGDGSDQIRITNQFRFTSPSSDPVSVDPERVGPAATRILDLLHRRVIGATLLDASTIGLEIEGGYAVDVGLNGQYEAWDLTLRDGSKVICLPSGGLAIWGPAPNPERPGDTA